MSQRLIIPMYAVLQLLLIYASTSAARKYSTYVTELIERLPAEYCPFTKYCQSNATYNLQGENQTACCHACSCEEDCWERGTCCPDIKSDTTKQRTAFCRSPMVKRWKNRSYSLKGYGYYVVTDCPTTETNRGLIQKCAGISQERYEDFVWVSDTDTNKIYNNKFCAECNGVQKYKDWYLTTDCPEILEGDYSFTDTNIVPATCSLSVVPPRGLDVPTNHCHLDVISECNQTGNWQTFDRGLLEACFAFEQHYFSVFFTSAEIYRNVFCYLCNKASGTIIKNVCKITDTSTRAAGPVFTTLLDHTFFKDPKEPNDYPCAINEVLDPFQLTCRKLTCPTLNAPFYGSCRRIALEMHFLSFKIAYRLEPLWEVSTFIWNTDTDPTLKKVGKRIYKEINKKIGLLNANCKTCLQNISGSFKIHPAESMIKDFPKHFVFSGIFDADKNCEEEFIIQQLLAPRGTNLTVQINKQMITFAIHILDKRSSSNIEQTTFVIFSDNQMCEPRRGIINLAGAKECPTITLTSDDYFALINVTATVSQRANVNALFGYSNGDLNKKTYSCFENYRNVFAAISGASLPRLLGKVWVICVTLLLYVIVDTVKSALMSCHR